MSFSLGKPCSNWQVNVLEPPHQDQVQNYHILSLPLSMAILPCTDQKFSYFIKKRELGRVHQPILHSRVFLVCCNSKTFSNKKTQLLNDSPCSCSFFFSLAFVVCRLVFVVCLFLSSLLDSLLILEFGVCGMLLLLQVRPFHDPIYIIKIQLL